MTLFKEYVLPRLVQWFLVIIIGVTITFLIPRLSPVNPVDQAIGRLTAFQSLSPEATLALRESLQDLYGLEGTIFDQYFNFWKRVLRGDLGPSFSSFPMTVNTMIGSSIGWTIGLLSTSVVIAWLLGVFLGSLAGYFPHAWWSRTLENTPIGVFRDIQRPSYDRLVRDQVADVTAREGAGELQSLLTGSDTWTVN